jgi:hypothetical protein
MRLRIYFFNAGQNYSVGKYAQVILLWMVADDCSWSCFPQIYTEKAADSRRFFSMSRNFLVLLKADVLFT